MQGSVSPVSTPPQPWHKDDNDACSESSSAPSSPLLYSNVEATVHLRDKLPSSTAACNSDVNVCSHINVCIQFFQTMIVPMSAMNAGKVPAIPTAVGHIYSDVIVMLHQLASSGALKSSLDHISDNLDTHQHESAIEMVKDLVMISSFVCSSSVKASQSIKGRNVGSSKASRSATLTPASAMIALAPYWAMVLLLSGNGQWLESTTNTSTIFYTQNDKMMNMGLILDSFVMLVTNPLTTRGSKEIVDEVLSRLNQLQNSMQKTMHATGFVKLFNRLKKFLKSAMVSPLHFMILFGLSMHLDLNNAIIDAFKTQMPNRQVLVDESLRFERDFVEFVITMVKISPNQAMLADRSNSEVTPLAYAAAYRGVDLTEIVPAFASMECLSMTLCRVLVQFCPSSMAIADKFGLFPLHLAARRGHSSTMSFLRSHFPYACPLRDATGKLALHHALLSHSHHNEASIVELATTYPAALVDDTAGNGSRLGFNVMHYVSKNCPKTLYLALQDIVTRYQETISLLPHHSCSSNESCTTEATRSSFSELSSSEGESDALFALSPGSGIEVLNVVDKSMDAETIKMPCSIVNKDNKKVLRKRKNEVVGNTETSSVPHKVTKSVVSEAEASILLQFADTLKMLYDSRCSAGQVQI